RLEGPPPEPDADRPGQAQLLRGCQRGIEGRQRDETEARGQQRHDALHFAEPAVAAALAAAPGVALRRFFFRCDDGGPQTSRIMGSARGRRRKRWLTSWRTAVRTVAPINSRSNGTSWPRSASAARTA